MWTQVQVHPTVEGVATSVLLEPDATAVLANAPLRIRQPAERAVAFAKAIIAHTTADPVAMSVLIRLVVIVPPALG